jgi:mono/diheme cytochrome c family protein
MASMPAGSRDRVGTLWNEFRRENPERSRDGAMFVRILEYVAKQQPGSMPARRFIQKWQHHNFGSAADRLVNRSMENGQRVYEQAACNRCHTINGKGAKYGPNYCSNASNHQPKFTRNIKPNKFLSMMDVY